MCWCYPRMTSSLDPSAPTSPLRPCWQLATGMLPPLPEPPIANFHFTVLGGLAFLFSCGVLLQILGCVLYDNWWPLLTAVMYVLLPIPMLFFSSGSNMDFLILPDSGGAGGDWEDSGRFLTGFSAVGSIAIPAVMYHGGLITFGALMIELVAIAMLGSSVILFIGINQSGNDGMAIWG